MKKYYISSKSGSSGICKYSLDFFELVLKDKGYLFIDSSEDLNSILTKIVSTDHVHIEIGIFQKKEIDILFTMLKAGYKNIAVTLHDAPLIKYPFRSFHNSFLNKVSKFYDIYINKFRDARQFVSKIKTIYVLSRKGVELIERTYNVKNVFYLPHILDERELRNSDTNNNNFIYFGFIGRNKGIEYSLKVHEGLLSHYPEINFYVVGRAIGRERKFYNLLKVKYKNNVHYLGYVPEDKVDEVFDKATFSILPFRSYKFFMPVSGSIVYNLKKGKIIFTNNVNVVSETIRDGETGFYLSGKIDEDIARICDVLSNKEALTRVKNVSYRYLLQNHTARVVSKNLISSG